MAHFNIQFVKVGLHGEVFLDNQIFLLNFIGLELLGRPGLLLIALVLLCVQDRRSGVCDLWVNIIFVLLSLTDLSSI